MVRLEGVHDNRDEVIFELSTVAASDAGAAIKASIAMFGRRPGKITAIEEVEVKKFGQGILSEYRVLFTISKDGDIKSILRLDEAVRALEERL